MPDEPSSKDPNSNASPGKEPRVPNRGWLVMIAILAFIPILMLIKERSVGAPVELSVKTFNRLVSEVQNGESSRILSLTMKPRPSSGFEMYQIQGRFAPREDEVPDPLRYPPGEPTFFRLITRVTGEQYDSLVSLGLIDDVRDPDTLWTGLLFNLVPFLILAFFIYFFFIRQIKMAGRGALSFGKSRARLMTKDRNKITFKDVAGVDESKEEVEEIVEFLKDPKRFQRLGARIPKGILLVGTPGTGKTLLAKAIAGEADASFFSISGSDFVEMFVGVGASRVRDMFEQAKKSTPCLIFIDEIDAVGRSRGVGLGGGNDEREQTLNALLVEMDGFDSQDGVIIIAATNRPDVLDPALLRPGRFDRQITVSLPDVRGREQILKVHAKKVKLEADVDLSIVARGTPGYSGADLANLLNEAALLAARVNKKCIGHDELEEARDKVRWGRERRSLAMTDEEKKYTAWHEAGHALVNVFLEHTHPLHKVTIIPRGQSLGSTMSLPEHDTYNRRRKEMLDMIAVTMAGRIAEELVSHDISTGASGDIQHATQLARSMVCQWGMSEKLGMIQYGSDEEVYMGRDLLRKKDYSEEAAREIDMEVKRIIDDQYHVAETLINAHRDKLQTIAEALLEYETLDGAQVEEICRTGVLTPPPPKPTTGGMTGAEAATPVISDTPKKSPPELPGLGAAAPATS